jgi:cytochrome b561
MPVARMSYGTTAKVFHWVIVALLAIQVPLGWLMHGLRRGQPPDTALVVHVSIGLSILALIVLRLAWRLSHPVAPESGLPAWQQVGAELVHWGLYLAVLGTALTGWLLDSARGSDAALAGGIPLPRLAAQGSAWAAAVGNLHATLVWVLTALVAAHVLAALMHLVVYKDRVMQRMLPGG